MGNGDKHLDIRDFIRQHAQDDVRMLALHAGQYPQVDLHFALTQIEGRQLAMRKLPSWAQLDDMLYPPKLSMEQCSSEAAALYKRGIVERILPPSSRQNMVDLTGGFGVDFLHLAPLFRHAVMVELQHELCEVVRHNASVLGIETDVVEGDGTRYLQSMPSADLIYIDPARRDKHGARTYAIEDCTPNVIEMCQELLQKSRYTLIKLSPMLDWREAVRQLHHVCEVHAVSVGNECKELLLLLSGEYDASPHLFCANDDDVFETPAADEAVNMMGEAPHEGGWLYEPNASIMKMGCYGSLCQRYGVAQLFANSHLFYAPNPISGFPGRAFRIDAVSTLSKSDVRRHLGEVCQANITVRNFPMTVDALRRRLKLKEGGTTYIFATTIWGDKHVLLVCSKEKTSGK